MPSWKYTSKNEKSVKPSKDQVTLLVGGNANDDKKLKPLIFYRSRLNYEADLSWNKKMHEIKKYCEGDNLDFSIFNFE
jgi:hypothetical protein